MTHPCSGPSAAARLKPSSCRRRTGESGGRSGPGRREAQTPQESSIRSRSGRGTEERLGARLEKRCRTSSSDSCRHLSGWRRREQLLLAALDLQLVHNALGLAFDVPRAHAAVERRAAPAQPERRPRFVRCALGHPRPDTRRRSRGLAQAVNQEQRLFS